MVRQRSAKSLFPGSSPGGAFLGGMVVVMKKTDIAVKEIDLYHLPIKTRVPLKFGTETLTSVVCARIKITVYNRVGETCAGWGETPLSVQWVWPSALPYDERLKCLIEFTKVVAGTVLRLQAGHAFELGLELTARLPDLLDTYNNQYRAGMEPLPLLAGLLCCSAFDLALHDAYGALCNMPVYRTYNGDFLNADLYDAFKGDPLFANRYPADFLAVAPPVRLPVWHLVGGKDIIDASEYIGDEPDDGYPVLLSDWIRRDGLFCLKVKLRGNDFAWDYDRMVKIGRIALETGVLWLSADFNCTVTDPAYVNGILDKLLLDNPRIYAMILYVEQPFPYDIEDNQIDVRSVSARKPLFMDESAHHWQNVKLGHNLGWSGVALKTCKTQTGALLSLCWAKAHGMTLMVQDLTNPMLAQIPHVLLAAYAGTIMGVESNSMQFYPEASLPEESIHPGIYRRVHGILDISTVAGPGFGMRVGEIQRNFPPAVESWRV